MASLAHRLVEAEAGGRVGEDVGVDGVRDVRLPVGDGALLGGEALHDAAEPREHGEAAVLELLDLELLEVTGLGEAEGVEAATGGHVTDGELVEDGVGEAGAVRLGEADEDDLDGEDGPEGGVARALGGEGSDGAGELVRDGGAVVGGAEGTGGEPGDAGAILGSPGTGHTEHRPAAVDDLTLGVLLGAEGDDGGLAATGVGAELGVDVGLDDLGHRLGLNRGKGGKRRRQSRVYGGGLARDLGVFFGICRRRERRRNRARDAMLTWTLDALRAATEPVKVEAMQAMIIVMSFGVCVAKLRVLEWLRGCGEPAFIHFDANQPDEISFFSQSQRSN